MLNHRCRATDRRLFSLILTAALAAPLSAGEFEPSHMVVFGDSLSDTGNVSILTFGIIPGAPYFDGRFSNGPVWIETLAGQLGLPTPNPSRAGGTNYAHGGAETGGGFSNLIVPNMGPQIDDYLGDDTPSGQELFVLWGGGNDFINGETNINAVVNNLSGHVEVLAAAGAQHFLLVNLPPLGQTPECALGTPNEATLDNRSSAFNAAYDDAIDALEADLGVDIIRFDTWSAFTEMTADPEAFGFLNVTDPAYDENTGQIVPNPEDYLFWDGIHPTTDGHAVLAARVFDEITAVPGDANDDGLVNVEDLVAIILAWGPCPPGPCAADLTGDGRVDVLDLVEVILNWGLV